MNCVGILLGRIIGGVEEVRKSKTYQGDGRISPDMHKTWTVW